MDRQDRHEVDADRAADAALAVRPRPERSTVRRGAPARRRTSGGGPGRPLTDAEAGYFEPRFGVDFSSVRVLAGSEATSSAQANGALAFTNGSAITFARAPDLTSAADRRLFAHELAHVVQQRREPSLAGVVQRKAPGTATVGISRVVIYRKPGRIRVTLTDGRTFTMTLVKGPSNIEPGTYRGVHEHDSEKTDAVQQADGSPVLKPQRWYFASTPAGVPTWKSLADSTYELVVHDNYQPAPATPSQGTKAEGEGKGEAKGKAEGEGRGQGEKGAGTGDKTGAGSGEKETGDKGTGDKSGEEGGTGALPTETDAEKKAKVAAVLKRLEALPDVGGKRMTPAQVAALAEMTAAELDDVVTFLKGAAVESDTPIDASAELDKYLALSPADRELLRVNQELMTDAKAGPLPEQVRIALDTSAATSAQVATQVKSLNDGLRNLAAIQSKVRDPELRKALGDTDLDPIDLEKLPVFREMMMLEGLLAGASTKSPEIEASAKELTSSIAGIRDYVLEEIAWLAAEVGASYLIGMLLGPVGTAAALGRAVMLLNRLNKLRTFLAKVEQTYSTYQRTTAIVSKVSSAWSTYKTFESEFTSRLADLERLKDLADDPNLDEEALQAATEKVLELEDQLVEKMLAQLETGTGLGALLEHFDIPADADEDDLRQILLDIPTGLRELDALLARYRASGRDLESVKVLTYKAVLVGTLLYPFVGYLARDIGGRLSALMDEPDLSQRLIGVIAGAAGGRGRKPYAAPGAKKTRARLAGAKRKPRSKAPKGTAPQKVLKEAPRKKSDEQDEPARKKKPDDPDDPARKKKPGEPDDAADKKDKDKKDDDGDHKDKSDQKDRKDEDKEPTSLEWLEVERKVGQLRDRNPDGITRRALKAQGQRIRKRHSTVAGAVSVTAVAGQGEWRIEIRRKPSGTAASATVQMGYRERWEAGRRAIEAWIPTLPADGRSIGAVRTSVQKFKDPYHYSSLGTKYLAKEGRRGGHRGVQVVGRMGKMGERDIAVVDDPTGLHTGRKNDPIPLWWYKDPGWYRGSTGGLRLPTPGVTVPFPAPASARHQVKVAARTTVTIGIEDQHILRKGSPPVQRTKSNRKADPPRQMREALEQMGVPRLQDADIDHVQDLGFGGTNDWDNLWPLERARNRYAFLGRWYRDYTVLYLAPDRRTVKRGALWNLVGKWFQVEGTATTVANWGGRDGEKP